MQGSPQKLSPKAIGIPPPPLQLHHHVASPPRRHLTSRAAGFAMLNANRHVQYNSTMAPNLARSQLDQIEDMIRSKCFSNIELASVVRCSTRSIRTIQSNLRCFGTMRAPPNKAGRPRTMTPPMRSALCDRLLEKPDMYQDEMAVFLGTSSRSS